MGNVLFRTTEDVNKNAVFRHGTFDTFSLFKLQEYQVKQFLRLNPPPIIFKYVKYNL